jgi:hypothetical protein
MRQPEELIREKFKALRKVMDERVTRRWAAAEAKALGRGGAALVERATGIRGKRIWMGGNDLRELRRKPPTQPHENSGCGVPGADANPSKRAMRRC